MAEESKKYFTPHEVEALIPDLTEIVGRLMDTHGELGEIRAALRQEQHRIMLSGGGILDQETWRERTRRLEELTRQVQRGIGAVVNLGGVPKDLGMGLVDFPYLVNDQEVNLCWRFGETTIEFWHGLDEGYTGRKPLEP
ncbi:MAG: DUF2203 domain-containing protein [Candidatus Rokuibacteriota bacterium]